MRPTFNNRPNEVSKVSPPTVRLRVVSFLAFFLESFATPAWARMNSSRLIRPSPSLSASLVCFTTILRMSGSNSLKTGWFSSISLQAKLLRLFRMLSSSVVGAVNLGPSFIVVVGIGGFVLCSSDCCMWRRRNCEYYDRQLRSLLLNCCSLSCCAWFVWVP